MAQGANTETTSPDVSLFGDGPDTADRAGSSDAQGADRQNDNAEDLEFSALAQDVIQQVTDASRGEPDGETQDSKAPGEVPEAGAAKSENSEEGADDYSDVPFHNHPRFKSLVQEKNDYKAQVGELSSKAGEMDKITSFLEANGLTNEEAGEGLEIMGLMKLNPVEAWEKLKPIAHRVAVQAGAVLTPDLQDKVSRGLLTADQAKFIAKAEAEKLVAQARLTHNENLRRGQEENNLRNSLREAAAAWEEGIKKTDADYSKKSRVLMGEVSLMIQAEGVPKTAAQVRDQLDRALAAVNKQTGALARPKPPINPVMGGNSAPPAGPSNADQASTLDIIGGVTSAR